MGDSNQGEWDEYILKIIIIINAEETCCAMMQEKGTSFLLTHSIVATTICSTNLRVIIELQSTINDDLFKLGTRTPAMPEFPGRLPNTTFYRIRRYQTTVYCRFKPC